MRDVKQEVLDRVMEFYNPDFRFLKFAKVDYPIGKGYFVLEDMGYASDGPDNITDIEVGLCLEQICRVYIGNSIMEKRVENFEDMGFEDYLEEMKENLLIVGSNKKFERKTSYDICFETKIEVKKSGGTKDTYVAKIDFLLNNGDCSGDFTIVLKRNKNMNQQTTIDDNYNA